MPTLTGKTWTLPPRPDGKLYMSDGEWTSGAQIWLSAAEIASLPESGTYWADVYARATSTFANPTGGNDDIADTNTLATALVAATGDSAMLAKCQGVLQAAVTGALTLETSLSSCRNLGNYAIAADLIQYYDAAFVNWIKTIVARDFEAWGSGQDGNATGEGSIFWKIWKVNNHGSMALGCFAALSYYLHRLEPANAQWRDNLDHIYQCLRYYSGEDPSITPSSLGYSGKSAWNYGPDSANWQQLIDSNYYVIYPQGAEYQTNSIDGLLPEEARRGSATYVYPAPNTTYYGESLQGLTVCYRVMSQAGYNVLPLGNYAHRRAVIYLYSELGYPLIGDDLYLLPLLDYMYGINAIQAGGLWGGVTVDQGKNMGWTDWSHGERVNYTIPAPLAPTIDSSDATSITIRFPASAASGHASWQVLRATAAQLPFYSVVATGVTAATYASTSLTTGTTYYHALQDVITSGRVSAQGASVSRTTAAASATPYDLTAGGTRTPPAWVTNGTFQWPSVPVTTTTFNVPADGTLATAIGTAGRRIIVAAGTYPGITILVNDLDIVLDSNATISGVLVGSRGSSIRTARTRITGGRITDTSEAIELNNCTDVLLDNVAITITNASPGGSNNIDGGDPATTGRGRRVAFINSTFLIQAAAVFDTWNAYTNANPVGSPNSLKCSDYLFANCKFGNNHPTGHVIRLQGIDRLLVVDCYAGYTDSGVDGAVQNNAMRFHKEIDYHWIADTYSAEGFTGDADSGSGSGYAYSIRNGTMERCTVGRASFSAISIQSQLINSVASDCLVRSNGTVSNPPSTGGWTDGNGTTAIAWPGSHADSSGYGADH